MPVRYMPGKVDPRQLKRIYRQVQTVATGAATWWTLGTAINDLGGKRGKKPEDKGTKPEDKDPAEDLSSHIHKDEFKDEPPSPPLDKPGGYLSSVLEDFSEEVDPGLLDYLTGLSLPFMWCVMFFLAISPIIYVAAQANVADKLLKDENFSNKTYLSDLISKSYLEVKEFILSVSVGMLSGYFTRDIVLVLLKEEGYSLNIVEIVTLAILIALLLQFLVFVLDSIYKYIKSK